MDQITEFKQFLNSHFSDLGLISLITAICLIVLAFATREIASWMTKTDKLRKDVKDLRRAIYSLEAEIQKLQVKTEAPIPVPTLGNEPGWAPKSKDPIQDTFKVNH
jgi:hypothetical protein